MANPRYNHHSPPAGRLALAAVPDLRFERSFLKGVSAHIKIITKTGQPLESDGGEPRFQGGEVVKIQWGMVLWYTTWSQIISPFLQGAIWGASSLLVRPLTAKIKSALWPARPAPGAPHPPRKTDGEFITRLRTWSKSLGATSMDAPARTVPVIPISTR